MEAMNTRLDKRIVNHRLRNRISRKNGHDEMNNKEAIIETKTGHYHYAGFWMRLWAFLIDLLTVFAIRAVIVSPLLKISALSHWTVETLLTAAVFFLYFAIMTKMYGQTIGKMIFGLKVISKDGPELTWSQIIFREGIGRMIHQIFLVLYLLYVTVAFTARKQGLHDMISDTYVIYEHSYKPVN